MAVLDGTGREALELLSGHSRPWHFAGGWAIDLYLGRKRREHKDADIAVPYRDQYSLRDHLLPRRLEKVMDGKFVPWNGELIEPPLFQFFAINEGLASTEFLLESRFDDTWVYRRDPSITLAAAEAFRMDPDGIPYLAPEIVLLFKSKAPHDSHNASDFEDTLPSLSAEQRRWFAAAIERQSPAHPWVRQLR